MPRLWFSLFACVFFSIGSYVFAADIDDDPTAFTAGVRKTDHLPPEEQLKKFILPPGFKIELVAAEPEIQKPMNLAFDARGRMWVTDSREYPFAAKEGDVPRDTIKVLEDTTGDGRVDKITTFADKLNIPIGIYPHRNGVIAYGIPNIWLLKDTDGDDRVDEREVLYGPFGYDRDTHGMNNAFRRGFDGWLYACHGYNNVTKVKGKDGKELRMSSGNTYRMSLDGEHIEIFTRGQVNPYGMTIDSLFNLFTADCHSKPIYQLVRGGYYPGFGTPHDGLGFVPPMMKHLHGSTAIAGVVVVDSPRFPKEFQGNFLSGNVMTSRINRNSIEYHGATMLAHEEEDFLICKDPWFRPVDVQMGPDGALYVLDFYNRIIGHYEVPLTHEGRDRTSGRIWRITYEGDDGHSDHAGNHDLTKLATAELIEKLDDPMLTTRILAANELSDFPDAHDAAAIAKAFDASKSEKLRSHAVWVLWRRGVLTDEQLKSAAADEHRGVRVQAMKIVAETKDWTPEQRKLALTGKDDADSFVQLAAIDALSRHPEYNNARPLLDKVSVAPKGDAILTYATRKALRDQLLDEANLKRLHTETLSAADSRAIADVALAIPTRASGEFLADFIEKYSPAPAPLVQYLAHSARFGDAGKAMHLIDLVAGRFPDNLDLQYDSFVAVQTGLRQQQAKLPPPMRDFGRKLAVRLLDSTTPDRILWKHVPLARRGRSNPAMWKADVAKSEEKDPTLFFHSNGAGEAATGIYRSGSFKAPDELQFYLAGHRGFPAKDPTDKSAVRLRDAKDNALLLEAFPPRSDIPRLVEWDLKPFAGKQVYIELVDGDSESSYSWIAAGKFSLRGLNPTRDAQHEKGAAELIGGLKLADLRPRLIAMIRSDKTDPQARSAAAKATLAIQPDVRLSAMIPLLDDAATDGELRQRIATAVVDREDRVISDLLTDAMRVSPVRTQTAIARELVGQKEGTAELLKLVRAGKASARLLEQLRTQLVASKQLPDIEAQIDELTANLPPLSELIEKKMQERRIGMMLAKLDAEKGAPIFEKNCAICHQLDGKGALIGPQLDGIGARGQERLLEDILDPNRNVDVAFRRTTFVLDDGRVLVGLKRREEGATTIIADEQGKEIVVPTSEIVERETSTMSLMPANVSEIVPEADFYNLISFLLEHKAAATAGSKEASNQKPQRAEASESRTEARAKRGERARPKSDGRIKKGRSSGAGT